MQKDLPTLLREAREETDASKLVELASEGTFPNVIWVASNRAGQLYFSGDEEEQLQGAAYFEQVLNGKNTEMIRYACTELLDRGVSIDDIKTRFYKGTELTDDDSLGYFFNHGTFQVRVVN